MHLADLNWMDVRNYLLQDDRIILITGSTEQHGYLSLQTDLRIPRAIATIVAEQEHVLVAPPINFGCSTDFVDFPGTIPITQQTFDMLLMDVVRGLVQHGFGGFFILNGHRGNAMPRELENLHYEVEGVRIRWHDWWASEAIGRFAQSVGQTPDHGNWFESYPFTRVSELPEGSKAVPDFDLWDAGFPAVEVLGDGSFGGPYRMPDEVMNPLFDLLVQEAVASLRTL